ncbi:hypothetical protein [Candidatus Thioglobus sp. NP1]|uniref:hypothetical protein n=1 Tax=Candidatus Thioglobus sp. NP1 TaxID=2508687 RepID=UPI000DEDB4B0|nr:hypothetical protein [Candidatus Thioglobus sp. NP1]AXE62021.1 hypothetical protein CRN91_04995 [Candidatus Thioglobus sp. NP1]
MKKILKVIFIILLGLFALQWIVMSIFANAELEELIRQGYLEEDYTKQDVVKLCNPQTDIEREFSKGANAMFSCVTKGNW